MDATECLQSPTPSVEVYFSIVVLLGDCGRQHNFKILELVASMHTANELLLVAGGLVALAAPVVPGRLCVVSVENPEAGVGGVSV